jgi:large subunit ribosomal protein L25
MTTETATLVANPRAKSGKGTARAARRAGLVPAVIYGGKEAPTSITIASRELVLEVARGAFLSRLIDVEVEGTKHRVLPRDVQLHPVTDNPLHVDFLRVTSDTKIRVMVAVRFIDEEESPGLKRGGVLNIVRHEVEFDCLADAIPESITASLDGLDIGDGIHISSITLPAGITPVIKDRDFTVATVAAPTIHVEEEVVTEGEEGEEGLEGLEGEEGAEGAEGEEGADGDENKKDDGQE